MTFDPFPPRQATGAGIDPAPSFRPYLWVHHCDCCGQRMIEKHCKIRCTNCGFIRDCSDP